MNDSIVHFAICGGILLLTKTVNPLSEMRFKLNSVCFIKIVSRESRVPGNREAHSISILIDMLSFTSLTAILRGILPVYPLLV